VTAGFYSPLPPARTGVADYSAALLEELRRHGKVEVAPARCDAALYHIGNNRLHAANYRMALDEPGVVVLHDAVLNHFLLGQLGREEYAAEFVHNYGEWNRGLGEELWQRRASSQADSRYFEYPMLRRIAERSWAVVAHNPAAAAAVRAHAPGARVVEIPHLFVPPSLPSESEAIRFRQVLGVAPDAYLFGVFGYLRESKRLMAILEVFARLRSENPRAMLLVAGEFVSSDLARAAEPLLAASGIVRMPFLSEPDFQLAACAVDACINLRSPAAGETSGIAIRMMGIGKPVLVTASEEWARMPEDACLRVAPGVAERESLWANMVLLTSVKEAGEEIGRRGAVHVHAHHELAAIGAQYWQLLREACS
jgi:hypothetical protein